MEKEKIMALVEKLKSQGHHGYSFGFGDSVYLFDKTDQVVYNAKTGYKLKWIRQQQKCVSISTDWYVRPTDGHGHQVGRLYLHQLNKYNTGKEFLSGI